MNDQQHEAIDRALDTLEQILEIRHAPAMRRRLLALMRRIAALRSAS